MKYTQKHAKQRIEQDSLEDPVPVRPVTRTGRLAFSTVMGLLLITTQHQRANSTPPSTTMPPPVVIQAARAEAGANGTTLEVAIQGRTQPELTGSGKEYVLLLPHAMPSPRLAASMASGGLVTRLSVETSAEPTRMARLTLALSTPASASLVREANPGDNSVRTFHIRFSPIGTESAVPLRRIAPGLYDIDAYQTDVATLFKSLARDGETGVVMTGNSNSKVTVNLHNVTVDQAIDLLTKAAGLTYHHEGSTYLVGTSKDIESAYPHPQAEPPRPVEPKRGQEVYRCRHVVASELLNTLQSVFEKEGLHVSLGASHSSPRLDDATTTDVTGVQANTLKGNSGNGGSSGGGNGAGNGGVSTGSVPSNSNAREIILTGEAGVVARARALAQELDARRQQVKIDVRITDISTDGLKQLGVQWNWSQYSVSEQASNTPATSSTTNGTTTTTSTTTPTVNGINFGVFGHTPVSVNATLFALEQNNQAKLLAAPSLSLLDGERSFILIGQRLLYPKLIGYSQANTPIFDKEEARVGIYLQVSAQIAADGEITLTLYPQVSVVTSYLNVNGASYPQISTREQQTTIRVKDGQQIVVGGLIHDEELKNIQRVPILGNIPFFGELFTYRNRTHSKDELVIMITPQIQKD